MAAKTINIEKFEGIAGNLFKGILLIAKRGRQINDRYKADEVIEQPDDYNEDEMGEIIPDEDYVPKPKPVVVAMDEYLKGDIKILDKDL